MNVHAGEKVKEYFEASGMSVSEFARRLHCHRQNVYDIFKRSVIEMTMLQRISRVLEHDFVSELYMFPKKSMKLTLKLVVTVEIENGQYCVTDVQPLK